MGVNTLPPGAPRSSSVLGLEQGLRSERVKSLNRRQGLLTRVAFPADRMGIPRGLPAGSAVRPWSRLPWLGPQGLRPPHLSRRDLGADAHGSRINVVPEFCWSPGSFRQGKDPPLGRPTKLKIWSSSGHVLVRWSIQQALIMKSGPKWPLEERCHCSQNG